MKRTLLLSVAALSALVFTGAVYADPPDQPGHVSPAPGTTNDTMSGVKDTARHVEGTISAEMTTTLKGFATAAAESDMYEVEAGKIAKERSGNADIRAFAAKMIAAHTGTTTKLKALLASHPDIVPPATLDDRHQALIDELRGAKDADFDGRYLAQQVDAHKEALILMKGYAKDGDVPSVKTFAGKTAPVVQSHLNMAEHLSHAGA
jgi:putative membrane protein